MPPKKELGKKRVGGRNDLTEQYKSAISYLDTMLSEHRFTFNDSNTEFIKVGKLMAGTHNDDEVHMANFLNLAQRFYKIADDLESEQFENAIEVMREHWQIQRGGNSAKAPSAGSKGRNMPKRVGGRNELRSSAYVDEVRAADPDQRRQFESAYSYVDEVMRLQHGLFEYSYGKYLDVRMLRDGTGRNVNMDHLLRVAHFSDELATKLESDEFKNAIETMLEYWETQRGGTITPIRPKGKGGVANAKKVVGGEIDYETHQSAVRAVGAVRRDLQRVKTNADLLLSSLGRLMGGVESVTIDDGDVLRVSSVFQNIAKKLQSDEFKQSVEVLLNHLHNVNAPTQRGGRAGSQKTKK